MTKSNRVQIAMVTGSHIGAAPGSTPYHEGRPKPQTIAMPIAFHPAEKPSQCPEVVFVDGHNPMELRFHADPDGYYLTFWVLPTVHCDGNPVEYQQAGADCGMTFTSDPDEADALIHGSVKWDGCMNYEVGYERDWAMLHACGRRHALAIAEAINHVYDRAAKLPKWRGK